MKDEFEKFIRDHREDFDDSIPDSKIWNKLETRLFNAPSEVKKQSAVIRRISRSGKRWLSAAAVLFIGLSLAAFIRTYQVKTKIANTAIPSDLLDAQAYYENRIALKIERIKSIELGKDNPVDTSLWQIFGQKDAEYERIRKDLHDNPDNPFVRSAFVEYYRSRLEVLKRIKAHLEK